MQRGVVPCLAIARPGIRGVKHYFVAVPCHRREIPVARLGFAQGSHAPEGKRARAEVEVLRRRHPGLAGLAVAGGGPS
jgi:hypothetical protein